MNKEIKLSANSKQNDLVRVRISPFHFFFSPMIIFTLVEYTAKLIFEFEFYNQLIKEKCISHFCPCYQNVFSLVIIVHH